MSSKSPFQNAQEILVGGVNSPVRAFKAVGGDPIFFKEGHGPYVISEDNKTYIDYVLSWGPLIAGHAHPKIVNAIKTQAEKGTTFGAPTVLETELARTIQSCFPSMEKVRFVSSGTESCMSVLRLARGYTNKPYIIKFDGCYHGHSDSMLVSAGSGILTLGKPSSSGVLDEFIEKTIVLDFNDLDQVQACFEKYKNQIAAIIIEPVTGNMGLISPKNGYLEGLQALCKENDTLLIFDEVMTGCRVSLGGAQEKYNIKPDLTCLGKVIGGGLPAAAFGGKKEIMDKLAPVGDIYQAGTLSGNPLAMAAGNATLTLLKTDNNYHKLLEITSDLVHQLQNIIDDHKQDIIINKEGSMFSIFFSKTPIHSLKDVNNSNLHLFKSFYKQMLADGIYFAPSPYESNFVSITHSKETTQKTVNAFYNWIKTL